MKGSCQLVSWDKSNIEILLDHSYWTYLYYLVATDYHSQFMGPIDKAASTYALHAGLDVAVMQVTTLGKVRGKMTDRAIVNSCTVTYITK